MRSERKTIAKDTKVVKGGKRTARAETAGVAAREHGKTRGYIGLSHHPQQPAPPGGIGGGGNLGPEDLIYVNTDIHPFTRQYLKANPWDDPEIDRTRSPITYIKNARTPTLIQHGNKDQRVPMPNAFELYQGLKDQNAPARLTIYKGFGHGIDKPKFNRPVMTHNEEWFSKWIWGGEGRYPTITVPK